MEIGEGKIKLVIKFGVSNI